MRYYSFSAKSNYQIAVPLIVAHFINRDVCRHRLKNTGIAGADIYTRCCWAAPTQHRDKNNRVALSTGHLWHCPLAWQRQLASAKRAVLAAFVPCKFLQSQFSASACKLISLDQIKTHSRDYHYSIKNCPVTIRHLRQGWPYTT